MTVVRVDNEFSYIQYDGSTWGSPPPQPSLHLGTPVLSV